MSKKAQEDRMSLIEESCPADPPISCNKFELTLLNFGGSKAGQRLHQIQEGNLAQVGRVQEVTAQMTKSFSSSVSYCNSWCLLHNEIRLRTD